MAVNLSPVGGVAAQFFTNTGAVLTGGKLYTYAAGTTTPATTYTSSQGTTAWTNPIVLDAAGRVSGSGEIWLTDGINYKFVLKDSNDVLIATYDNVSGINSNFVAYTNSQQIVTATAGQTVFNLSISYQPGTNSLSVFVDGVNQYGPGAQYAYTETDSDTVTFVSGLHVGAQVKFTSTQQQGAGAVDSSQVTYDPPFTGSVATNVEAKLAQYISVKDFGAVGNGVADDTTAIEAAIAYAATAVAGSTGASVYFPTGTYLINKTINMPNRVGLQGANSRGTTIKPKSPFTGVAMFYASNGVSSMFGSWIRDMFLDSSGFNLASAVVVTDAWQETCGMSNVVISFDGTTPYGLLVQNGYGGAAYLPLRDIEIFSNSTVTNAGIRVAQISLVGGFVLSVDGLTTAGTVTNPMDVGIQMVNDSLYVKGLHCEYVDTMIAMNGAGSLSADTCTGSSVPVIDMVSIGAGFTGQVSLRNMIPNGATGNVFKNNITSANIPASEGMLASYDYQPSAFGAYVSAQIPNVTGNGTEYQIVFDSELYDYLGEYNNATGTFTASRSGKYIFTVCVKIAVATAVTTYVIKLSTSNREYYLFRGDTDAIRDGTGALTLSGSLIADLDKNDTARVRITITGLGADTVDVEPDETFFEGHWLSR